MLQPLSFQHGDLLIHPFGPKDLERYEELIEDVFGILGDRESLQYVPGKFLENEEAADLFLKAELLNFHSGRNFLHFITDVVSGRVIGLVDIVSPELARDHYRWSHYPYFIEFYLSSEVTGCSLMSGLLPPIIDQMQGQGIKNLGAVVHRHNIAARTVLERSSFRFRRPFDVVQDFYELS